LALYCATTVSIIVKMKKCNFIVVKKAASYSTNGPDCGIRNIIKINGTENR